MIKKEYDLRSEADYKAVISEAEELAQRRKILAQDHYYPGIAVGTKDAIYYEYKDLTITMYDDLPQEVITAIKKLLNVGEWERINVHINLDKISWARNMNKSHDDRDVLDYMEHLIINKEVKNSPENKQRFYRLLQIAAILVINMLLLFTRVLIVGSKHPGIYFLGLIGLLVATTIFMYWAAYQEIKTLFKLGKEPLTLMYSVLGILSAVVLVIISINSSGFLGWLYVTLAIVVALDWLIISITYLIIWISDKNNEIK